ncbi:hypothetical protein F5144DRAFT_587457, partial [Chaetomium tenue]
VAGCVCFALPCKCRRIWLRFCICIWGARSLTALGQGTGNARLLICGFAIDAEPRSWDAGRGSRVGMLKRGYGV